MIFLGIISFLIFSNFHMKVEIEKKSILKLQDANQALEKSVRLQH